MDNVFNVGILGCSKIAVRALIEPASKLDFVNIYGAASRTYSNAKKFCEENNIDNVYENYDALPADDKIDFVYISLPNHLHFEWIIKSIKAGKNILVEKPICLKAEEAKEIMVQSGGNILIEGLMTQFHPWQEYIKQIVDDKRYGELKKIETNVCIVPKYDFTQTYRAIPEMGGGAFYDLGCYWLQFLQYIIGIDETYDYFGESDFTGPNNCDWTFKAEMKTKSNIVCDCVCSYEKPYNVSHMLKFEKASVTVKDFFRCILGDFKMMITLQSASSDPEKISFDSQNYYTNQLIAFCDMLKNRDIERSNILLKESLQRVEYIEKIMRFAKKN